MTNQREITFPTSYNVLSITQPSSHIKYANSHFCEVAGYSHEELVSQPHNIVRNPDMPKAAFHNMWEYLKDGKSWMGLVKNRCKNGDYYWVDAFASPIMKNGQIVEYQSVRFVPNREYVKNAERLYKQLNEGKTPLKLKLPRTKLWHRMALLAAPIGGISAGIEMLVPSGGIMTALSLMVGGSYLMTARLRQLETKSQKIISNPTMELAYTNAVDDFSSIEFAMKMTQTELNAIVGRILDSNEQIQHKAQNAADNCERTNNHLVNQTLETEQVAAAVEQLRCTTNEIAQNAQNTALATDNAQKAAQEGQLSVVETLKSMENLAGQLNEASSVIVNLNEHSQRIGQVLQVIQEVAEQTNLLALNAAIEAARAGEQGRGFAVVADEVRQLAHRSSSATEEIQQVIKQIQQGTQQAVNSIEEGSRLSQECVKEAQVSGEKIDVSLEGVVGIAGQNEQIATAIEEVASVIENMNPQVQSITEACVNAQSLAFQSRDLCENVSATLHEQGELVHQFRRV